MRGNPFRIATLLLGLAAVAGAQTPTPTPTPSPTPNTTATPAPVNTLAVGVTHATEASARVNGVKIQVAPDGSVWFMEATADRIGVLRGNTITYWQLRTTDQLGANPVDFEIDGNTIWFIESGESTIPAGASVFASLDTVSGALTEWVIPGSIPAGFYRSPPDPNENGKITVWLPQTSGRLQAFNLDENAANITVTDYRSASTFAYADMVLGPDGALWLADFGNNRIVRFDTNDLLHETSWTMLDSSLGLLNTAQIQFDDQGNLWLAQLSANRMDRFNPTTGALSSFPGITGPVHFDIFGGNVYIASSQATSAVSILDPRLGAPITRTLTSTVLDVGSTDESIAVSVLHSVIAPTTFDSPETAITAANINVAIGGAIGSLTTNMTALAHTYSVDVDGGFVWVGVDGQLVRLVPQAVGGTTDQSVPVALSLAGAEGYRIRVDVTLSNRGTGTVGGDVLYLYSSGQSPQSAAFNLPAGATKELTDAFGNQFGGSNLVVGPVRIRVTTGSATDLVATVRTTRLLPGGASFGFELPAADAAGGLGAGSSTTLFTGARDSDVSVLGFYTLAGATGTLTLVAPDGTVRGTRPFNLATNIQQEFNPAASAFGVDAEPGDVVRVAVTAGSLQAYVNVLDTGTTDVASAQPVAARTDAIVPNAGEVLGGGSKSFVSDLYLSDPGDAEAHVDLTFYPLGSETPQIASLTLAAGESRAVADLLLAIFGVSSGQGSFFITSDVPVASAVRIGARTAQGDFGTFAASLDGTAGIAGRSGEAIGLAQTATIRSHLLLYNRGIAGEISVTGFGADGTAVGPVTVKLGDHQAGRLNSVFAALGVSELAAGRIRIDVPEGMNVFAWTARVDGFSGDVEIGTAR